MNAIKAFVIRKLGGFSTVNEAIEEIIKRDGPEKFKILNHAVKRLFNTLDEDDILKVTAEGNWIFQGKQMTDGQKKMLIAEATQFVGTKLWEVLQIDLKYQANRKMYIESKSDMDLVAGKLWTFTINTLKTRLTSLVKGSGLFNNR